MKIDDKTIDRDSPVYIVAELSCNHLNDFSIVEKTVSAAAQAGVDAIKLATLTPDTMTLNLKSDDFIINSNSVWDGRTYYDLYTETSMPYSWHEPIMEIALNNGISCFSTPYDVSAAKFLHNIDMPAYKIASFEITDVNLIREVASYGKPVILSTGIATKKDIKLAVDTCRDQGNDNIILLKCTSGYPAPFEELNLRTIKRFKEDFGVCVGLSDHTLGIEVPVVSVGLGVRFIEKHIILDRALGGPDAYFSLEPEEFKQLVLSVRNVEKALGRSTYELTESSRTSRQFSRSLYVVKEMKKGDIFTEENVRSIRPGYGMHPKYLVEILGKRAACHIREGSRMEQRLIE